MPFPLYISNRIAAAIMVVTLIGYRGTGKSTIAGPLAQRLGWTAIDADAEIERRAGRSIREIFETDGEPEFRRLEREVISELLSRNHLVIAAGGGAVMNPDTRSDMQNAGPVIWLRASLETILSRMAADDTTTDRRPSLTDQNPQTEVEKLLAERKPVYEETASIVVDTDNRDVGELVEEIVASLPADIAAAGESP